MALFTQGRVINVSSSIEEGVDSLFKQGVNGQGVNPFLGVREDEVSSYLGERRPLLFSREGGAKGGRLVWSLLHKEEVIIFSHL